MGGVDPSMLVGPAKGPSGRQQAAIGQERLSTTKGIGIRRFPFRNRLNIVTVDMVQATMGDILHAYSPFNGPVPKIEDHPLGCGRK